MSCCLARFAPWWWERCGWCVKKKTQGTVWNSYCTFDWSCLVGTGANIERNRGRMFMSTLDELVNTKQLKLRSPCRTEKNPCRLLTWKFNQDAPIFHDKSIARKCWLFDVVQWQHCFFDDDIHYMWLACLITESPYRRCSAPKLTDSRLWMLVMGGSYGILSLMCPYGTS